MSKSFNHKITNKLLYYYTIFQAFPVFVVVVNITFYFFPSLVINYSRLGKIKISHYFQWVAILFGIGAIVSTIDSKNINTSLIVLPNYLYWVFIIIFFYNYRKVINFTVISTAVYHGLFLLNIFYWTVERGIGLSIPGVKYIGENGYAILMICFVPLTLKRIDQRKGRRISILFLILFMALGFASGSRAGAVLIGVGSFFTLAGTKLTFKRITLIAILVTMGYLLLFKVPVINSLIFSINEDVHKLVYSTQEVVETDQSYLLRRAMVEKGLILFDKDPLTGVGLNNWMGESVQYKGDFIGAERIINKEIDKFSAHNSYIGFLGEGGLLVFIPFVMILLITIITLFRQYGKLDENQRPILWGLIMMSVHIYFISAMLNSFTWFFIAIGGAAAFRDK